MNEMILKNGKKVIFRKPDISDAKKMLEHTYSVAGESNNLTFGKEGCEFTKDDQISFINTCNKGENKLLLLAIIDDEVAGMLSFMGNNKPRTKHMGDLGVTVLKKYWNMGIGTILMEKLINWAENNEIIDKLILYVKEDNESAIHIYEKLGFKKEGNISRYFKINDKFYSAIVMGLNID